MANDCHILVRNLAQSLPKPILSCFIVAKYAAEHGVVKVIRWLVFGGIQGGEKLFRPCNLFKYCFSLYTKYDWLNYNVTYNTTF